jgi:hypothetical protein
VLVANDISSSYASSVEQVINTRIRKGTPPNKAFANAIAFTLANQAITLFILILGGTLLYKLVAKEKHWVDSVFYAIASCVSVGYGSVDFNHTLSCYAVGIYGLLCHYVVFLMVIPKVSAFWLIAVDDSYEWKQVLTLSDDSSIGRTGKIDSSLTKPWTV